MDRQIEVIYNPYTRHLTVFWLIHGIVKEHTFESTSEWINIDHPVQEDQYLSIQLDYDEHAQLIVYFESTDSESKRYSDSLIWYSGGHRKDENIHIVHSDYEEHIVLEFLRKRI